MQSLVPDEVRRVLLISATALGDTLFSTPAIRALKERYPAWELEVLANRGFGYGGEIDVDATLETFLTARRWNLRLWRRLDAEQLGRVAFHPSRGNETLAVTLRALAGHTLSHLRQLEAIG